MTQKPPPRKPPRVTEETAAEAPLDESAPPPGYVACMLCERVVEQRQAALASRPEDEAQHICGRCLAEQQSGSRIA